jgi:hypothetical protein
MSATDSKRVRFLAAVVARLEVIRQGDTNGEGVTFNTDAGRKIFLGEDPVLGPDDPPQCICIEIQDDEPGSQKEHVVYELPIEVQAIVPADTARPYLAAEAVLADIKAALELDDKTFGGICIREGFRRGPARPLPRPDGSTFVGVAVTYRALLAEKWGHP